MAEIDLEALAARVEKLEGQDREADYEIACAIGVAQMRGQFCYSMHPVAGSTNDMHAAAPYTASLDAALTLVPEGWRLYAVDASIDGRFYVSLRGPIIPCNDPDREGIIGVPSMAAGCANSLALAMCSAALRARLMEGEGE